MSYSTGIAMKASLMEEERSGRKRLTFQECEVVEDLSTFKVGKISVRFVLRALQEAGLASQNEFSPLAFPIISNQGS